MRGDLGLEIPTDVKFLDCSADSTRTTHLCLTWNGHAQLWIDYSEHENAKCYKIAWWGQRSDMVLKDCYDIEGAHWYGGGFLTEDQQWLLDNVSIAQTLFITGNFKEPSHLGPVIERYWLNSKGIAIYSPSDYPLFISINDNENNTETRGGKFCFVSHHFDVNGILKTKKFPEMNYTICVSEGIHSVHNYALNKTLLSQKKTSLQTPPDAKLFTHTVWSTKALRNVTQESVTKYCAEIAAKNYSHNYLILNSNWEEFIGDLIFNAHIFPDVQAMLQDLKSQFTLSLSLTPFVDIRSENFGDSVKNEVLVVDVGGQVPGLARFSDELTNASVIAGVMNSRLESFSAILTQLKNLYDVHFVLLKNGDVRSLPFGADHGALSHSNVNRFTEYYAKEAAEVFSTVFSESASQAQLSAVIIAIPPLPSTWEGLQSVIPKILTLGLLGYPFALPEVIGGSTFSGAQAEQELYIRWLELSAFLPIMHFSVLPDSYDAGTVQIARKFIHIHSSVVAPIAVGLRGESLANLQPIVRPLWWVSPWDSVALAVDDQFLIGNNLLVAPMLQRGRKRDIYLPEGFWLDKKTETIYTGPQWIKDYTVQLDEVPYFLWQSQ